MAQRRDAHDERADAFLRLLRLQQQAAAQSAAASKSENFSRAVNGRLH
jgi:hypothetical protein